MGSATRGALVAVRRRRDARTGCGTKWSGLYFIVFFGLMTLAFDVSARRQYRVPRPWLGAVRRDLATVYALLLIPFGVYLASYAPWFASETAIDRHEVGQSIGERRISHCPMRSARCGTTRPRPTSSTPV